MGPRIGDDGYASTVMTPAGYVSVGDKRYQARAQVGFIESGQRIVVLGGDNNGLIVGVAEDGKTYDQLPGFGRPCFASFGERAQDRAHREEEARQRWLAHRQRYLRRVGLGLGALASCAGLLLARPEWVQRLGEPNTFAASAVIVAAGALLVMFLLGTIEHTLRALNERFHRFSIPTTCLGLLGGLAGAFWAIPAYGLVVGLLTASALGFLLLLPVPVLALFVSSSGAEAGPGDGMDTGMVGQGPEDP